MKIKDSGNRREFDTGAVRDVQEGKGRCDLLPLDVIGKIIQRDEFICINSYIREGDTKYLESAIDLFIIEENMGWEESFLEVAKHFEEGAKKYGERNWEKGIPLHCYIDSAVRHLLMHLIGDKTEPHDRAFMWNILCAIWTHKNKPEMIDLPFEK